jgi:hypothetical protein
VIKHNANQRYATNAVGAAMVRKFAAIASDVPGSGDEDEAEEGEADAAAAEGEAPASLPALSPEEAAVKDRLAGNALVAVQEFAVKADSACGTTIGPITAGNTGIRTVDVGPPQLSMHSCRGPSVTQPISRRIDQSGFIELIIRPSIRFSARPPVFELNKLHHCKETTPVHTTTS